MVSTWSNGDIQTHFRTIDGLSIRFAESEDRDDHALLLSPWPESLFAFEPTWKRLAEHTHLVAIDLPGFGHSQRSDALLSPRAMGEFVIRVSDAFPISAPAPRCSPRRCVRDACGVWWSGAGVRRSRSSWGAC
jgi:pimeloyl-ACP methyl ester carboxylesterase